MFKLLFFNDKNVQKNIKRTKSLSDALNTEQIVSERQQYLFDKKLNGNRFMADVVS